MPILLFLVYLLSIVSLSFLDSQSNSNATIHSLTFFLPSSFSLSSFLMYLSRFLFLDLFLGVQLANDVEVVRSYTEAQVVLRLGQFRNEYLKEMTQLADVSHQHDLRVIEVLYFVLL